jgi:hypothetical protein
VINLELVTSLQKNNADLRNLNHLVDEVIKWQIPIDKQQLEYEATIKINSMMSNFTRHPDDLKILTDISGILAILHKIELKPSLNELQNQLFQIGSENISSWSKSTQPSNKLLLNNLLKLAHEVELDMTVPVPIKKSR